MSILNYIGLEYYSPTHILMLLAAPIIFCIFYFSLRNRTEKTKRVVLLCLAIFNALIYIAYKIVMAFTFDVFIILKELPLHLCNLNLILIPLAILTNNKLLMSYLYYVGLLAAFAGIMFFDSVFLGKNVFSFVVLVYFIYHAILLVFPLLLVSLKLFTPSLSYVWKALVVLVSLALIMHLVNLLFIHTGWCVEANYFYTMGMPDNPVLGMLMKLIPIPFLYYLPVAPVLYGFDVLITLPQILIEKRKNK
ncbi:MAG: YwaF family protein [Clostridia bacterium]|nr:YwaF family protein [Clostridia bacterium]